jgi:hypothetical protein
MAGGADPDGLQTERNIGKADEKFALHRGFLLADRLEQLGYQSGGAVQVPVFIHVRSEDELARIKP